LRLEGTVLAAAQARRSNRQPARDIIKVNKREKEKKGGDKMAEEEANKVLQSPALSPIKK
jgi:hypothetical protein